MWVILHNTTFLVSDRPSGMLYLVNVLAHTGWIGVQLFFALSGFLITGGLLDSQGAPHYFRDFYARRALRILPLYYSVLLLLLVVLPHFSGLGSRLDTQNQASLWLFITNWTQATPYGFSHFWSLAVEEQFYIVWPLLVYRLPARRLFFACLWIAAGALLMRAGLSLAGADAWTIYDNTLCRMDALALGGAGACVLRLPAWEELVRRRLGTLGVLALVVFLAGIPATHVYSTTGFLGQTLGYSVLAACGALCVLAAALSAARSRWSLGSLLALAPLRSCGKYSYAMYIFHNLLHKLVGEFWLVQRFGRHPPAQVIFGYALAVLVASYGLAFVSYYAVEQPFLRLKNRFEPRVALANVS